MAIKWSPLKYGCTRAQIGAFDISAGWDDGAYRAEVDTLGIRVKGIGSLDEAKTRAVDELRSALKAALTALSGAKEGT